MAAAHQTGALQPDGTIKPEGTLDVQHVANTIVHIAGLPLEVTVLTFNIMYVLPNALLSFCDHRLTFISGLPRCLSLVEDDFF